MPPRPVPADVAGAVGAWERADMGRVLPSAFDGVPVPPAFARILARYGDPIRLAVFGKVIQVGVYDFGPGVGRLGVCLCEKWGGSYNPANLPPWDVQGMQGPDLARVRAALGA